MPPSLDWFGWCTWDAFYTGVTGEGIVSGVRALTQAGVPPRMLIIDDGWQDTVMVESKVLLRKSPRTPSPLGDSENCLHVPRHNCHVSLRTGRGTKGASSTTGAPQERFPSLLLAVVQLLASRVEHLPGSSFLLRLWARFAPAVLAGPLLAIARTGCNFPRRLRSPLPSSRFLESLPATPGRSGSIPRTLSGSVRADSPSPPRVSDRSLASFVARLRQDLGVKFVYCWHAIAGYWSGVDDEAGRAVGALGAEPSAEALAEGGDGRGVGEVVARVGCGVLGAGVRQPVPSPGVLEIDPGMAWHPITLNGVMLPDVARAGELFEGMHSFLAQSGVDGVKVCRPAPGLNRVPCPARGPARNAFRAQPYGRRAKHAPRSCQVDGQATLTMLGGGAGGSAVVTRGFIHALEDSVQSYFGSAVLSSTSCDPVEPTHEEKQQVGGTDVGDASQVPCINCMCHPLECLYAYRQTSVARASDDFWPRDPASQSLHVAHVAYNSVFLGEIVTPDWDMFQARRPLGWPPRDACTPRGRGGVPAAALAVLLVKSRRNGFFHCGAPRHRPETDSWADGEIAVEAPGCDAPRRRSRRRRLRCLRL